MRTKIKSALKDSIQDLVDLGAEVKFTKKELNELGVVIPKIQLTPKKIRTIRDTLSISQSVFAELLNVSLSSIRQWEVGARTPTGSSQVLLEILERNSHALDYRLGNIRD